MELFSLFPTVNFSLLPLLPLLVFLILFYYQTLAETLSNSVNTCRQLITLVQMLRNSHRFLDWSTEVLAKSPTHTATIKTPLLVTAVSTANQLNVEHMLKTNFENYPKGDLAISVLEDFLGRGIFNSDGEHWRRQRKSASLEFSKRSLRSFVMDVVDGEVVGRLLPLLAKAGEDDEVVDLQDVFERFAFDNICKLALGEDPAALYGERAPAGETTVPSDFMKAFADSQNLIVNRFMAALSVTWKIKRLLNVGSEKKLKHSASTVHDFTRRIAKLRRERPSAGGGSDLLSRFASDKDNTEELLRDIAISFILAGRETTSSALTWFFWLLSSRPDVEEAILEETRSVRERNQNFDGTFSFDELREMNYLHAAITEAMRLYPPVPNDSHSCLNDDVMPDGTFVGRGWIVSYSAYAMGRMEDIWGADCRDYKPERWLENGAFQPENPYKYPVFHAGPRMCLGKEMAYIQMKSIAASMLERFDISVMMDKEKAPEQLLRLTLRMKGGLPHYGTGIPILSKLWTWTFHLQKFQHPAFFLYVLDHVNSILLSPNSRW